MSLLAANHPDARDAAFRSHRFGTITTQSDTDFGSTYAWGITTAGAWVGPMTATKTLDATGEFLILAGGFKLISEAFSADHVIAALDNAGSGYEIMDVTTRPQVQVKYNNSTGKLYCVVLDNNAGTTTSADGATTIGSSAITLQLKVEWTSSTTLAVTLKINNSTELSFTHTNAGGLGTMTFARGWIGNDSLAKGETVSIRVGGICTVNDEITSGPGYTGWPEDDHPSMQFALLLPTDNDSDPSHWTASGGGAPDFSEIDDAFGSYSSSDWNTSGTTASDRDYKCSGWTNSIGASDTIYSLIPGMQGTQASASTRRIIVDDGTEQEQTPISGITGVGLRVFNTDSGGNDWVPSDIDPLVVTLRRKAAFALEWRVHAIWLFVLYEAAAAAATTRSHGYIF